MGADSASYRCGPATPYKQDSFRQALGQCIGIAANLFRRGWLSDPFLFIDMNAGPGTCQEPGECPHSAEPCSDLHGSPLVALRLLTATLPDNYRAVLFEADGETRSKLAEAVHGFPLDRVILGERARFIAPEPCSEKARGMVYVDPSNADIEIEILTEYATAFPKVDILINLACASYKRGIKRDDYERLSDTLDRIGKTRWAVRRPHAAHQWAMLYGSNWQPEHPPSREWRHLDTEEGRQWFGRIIYTRAELRNGEQRELF